jgi:hypothetical protein
VPPSAVEKQHTATLETLSLVVSALSSPLLGCFDLNVQSKVQYTLVQSTVGYLSLETLRQETVLILFWAFAFVLIYNAKRPNHP